ncbi:MAG: SpoIIE family protein phosphatase [Clostridia bacterium]|nr:SpoIIE family protein phosphatase [Clostridia bacterium]
MEKITASVKPDISDRLWDRGIIIMTCTLYFVSGFILSGAELLSMQVPLSIGLAAACTGYELIFASIGGIAGAALRLSTDGMINAILPLAGIAGTIFVLEKLAVKRKRRLILSVSTFIFSFVCKTAVMFSEEPSFNGLILIFCSSLLCGGSVVFYSGTADCIKRKQNIYLLDNHSLICITASLCTLLLGASQLSILGFRPARFFGAFVILTASYLFRRSGGSIAGIAIGGCIAVSGTGVALSICYGMCGLLSGIFSKFGRFICALTFSLTAGIAALLDGSAEGISVFAEAAAASFVFAAIPGRHLRRIRSSIANPGILRAQSEFCSAGERLNETAKAIGSVSQCVSSVSKGIDALSPAGDIIVCMRVRERICSECPLKNTFCPEEGEFSEITKKLSQGETVSCEDFSVNFNSKCPSVPRIADSFNRVYAGQKAINAMQANSARSRELACSQFDWISDLLKELSEEIGKGAQVLFNKEKSAMRVLADNGFGVVSVSCINPPSGALRLTCIVEEIPVSTSLSHLTAELSRELEAQLLPPKIKEHKNGKELVFTRKELFKIRIGSAAASCGNQKLCGDYFECFRTESKAYIILSDGMGTGGRAAIDSAMTVELFSRLIRAGVSLDTALSITNSALSVKSDDESLSTLDVAEIDLFSGNTVLYKAGAAASFYTCSGRVRTVESPSSPLGILSKVKFSRYTLKLRGGDTLVMVSDGILGSGSIWLRDEIKAFSGGPDASEFSENILESARRRCGAKFDDMTVISAVAEEV